MTWPTLDRKTWGVLASCARPDGAYAAIAECANEKHEKRCGYHVIVMEQFVTDLRSSLALDKDWNALGDGWVGSPEDAAIVAQLIREARDGTPHQCQNAQFGESRE